MTTASREAAIEHTRQLVTFDLGGERYGVDILAVREIIRPQAVRDVPDSPDAVRGVINLRGIVIPIVDLHVRFSLPQASETEASRIVVIDIDGDPVGFVVDAVDRVLRIETRAVDPAPRYVLGARSSYIEGFARIDESLVTLLDLGELLSSDALSAFKVDFAALARAEAARAEANAPNAAVEDEPQPEAIVEEAPIEAPEPVPPVVDEAPVPDPEPAADEEPAEPGLDVETLETTFALLAPRGEELVERFYANLFAAHPGLEAMFANANMAEQRGKLLSALATVVASLRQPEVLVPHLQRLGARHVEYGVEPSHYSAVGGALLQTLAEMAGDLWTPTVRDAWANAYGVVADVMIEAASPSMEQAA
ncbi:MAG: chemotaxis protein CheW [Dehalococcoidia bacterium]